ncbi:MAG: hypothetical protein WB792_16425 [Desulfobacterales bacterium]
MMNIEAISKKSFRPIRRRRTSIGVEPSSQVLDILEYACGLILRFALISTENFNFEMASSKTRLVEGQRNGKGQHY